MQPHTGLGRVCSKLILQLYMSYGQFHKIMSIKTNLVEVAEL